MCRYKRFEKINTLRVEGNNGGDYLEITCLGDNLIHLRVGHCGVTMIDRTFPIEILTATLAAYLSLSPDSISKLWNADLNPEFVNRLISQVS